MTGQPVTALMPPRLEFPDGWNGWRGKDDDPNTAWRLEEGTPIYRHQEAVAVLWFEAERLIPLMRRLTPVGSWAGWRKAGLCWRMHPATWNAVRRSPLVPFDNMQPPGAHQLFGLDVTYAYVDFRGDPWPIDRVELYSSSADL